MAKSVLSKERQEWDNEPDATALEHAGAISDFHAAEAAYRLLVDKGSILSMANLGSRYEFRSKGDGGPDFAQAEFWYRKAVDSGSAVSTLPAGYFYLRRKDYDKAREIFSIGMERDYAPSITRLGDLYVKGIGVERDYDIARALFNRASDLGNLWAQAAIAAMTISLATNQWDKLKGVLMMVVAGLKIRLQRWREPRSERLKK
ncbi:tetratricopeptide repeat protein [Paraburkholderia sp. A1RI_3L]|uniref:tetratricopeptide repeat protein n=1 Tax=Paraburkholderia TaxID=1822464 RepID=UPI003B81528A